MRSYTFERMFINIFIPLVIDMFKCSQSKIVFSACCVEKKNDCKILMDDFLLFRVTICSTFKIIFSSITFLCIIGIVMFYIGMECCGLLA